MRVSREFKAHFDRVARHYLLAELGELEEAKEAVRRDPEGAATYYKLEAERLRAQGA